MHASPRSNHREHAPCTRPNTHSHTRMHRLAAISVRMRLVHTSPHSHTCMHRLAPISMTMRLVQAQTHTLTRACIASLQSAWECALCTTTHKKARACIALQHCRDNVPYTSPHALQHTHAYASQQSPWLYALCIPKHKLQHVHASPRSNHREHAPCTSPNTLSGTRVHHLAAITVSTNLIHEYTQKYRHD